MTLCFLGGSLRCEGGREVQILIDVVKTQNSKTFLTWQVVCIRNNSKNKKNSGRLLQETHFHVWRRFYIVVVLGSELQLKIYNEIT